MVGKLVAERETDPVRLAIVADDVQAGDLGLFATVERKRRHLERLFARAHDRAVALVKPFGRDARAAAFRLAAFNAHAKHFHAVRQRLHRAVDLLVHRVARVGAAQMGQTGAGDVAVRGIRMVERRQQAAVGGDLRIRVGGGAEAGGGQLFEAAALRNRGLRQRQHRHITVDFADQVRVLLQHADAALAGNI